MRDMPDIEPHDRVYGMFLDSLERSVLLWLSARMPRWVYPDLLTGIGLLGAIMIFAGYGLTNVNIIFLWLASLGFVVNWFGDSMDGTLARYRKIERPHYGYWIDHTVDAACALMMFVGIGISKLARMDFAALAGIGYLLMTTTTYLGTLVHGKFHVSYAKISPTELRLGAVLLNTLIFFFGNPSFKVGPLHITVFDLSLLACIGFSSVIFVIVTIKEASRLSKIDPGPKNRAQ